ncbi:membrane-bound lytic murein transglycosylase F [Nicoletella semolina]|uniref:Membrane-bound lytic murein transglycosylase F n=1 Tax=Nicoletella semolina TaxID=271160 RepID=A0A4R2N9V4_9PAST|nr:membrane-bound lytic murein transglycosylase MltF [Nicoletella semolina]MDH2925302.1 lytic transglycosylase F [Nicoletella semolina]TCP17777.1 membrane-bound lytic murein transglycosylase F [Nicoletella semolina]
MKGLIIRLVISIALLLWAWDMVSPWQQAMQAEENRYTQIQQRKIVKVGMINHPLFYFIGNDGTTGIEYDLTSAFADFMQVDLKIKSFKTSEELFSALKSNQIDIAAAGLLYQTEQAQQFNIGPKYYSASWQVVYRKGTQRPYKLEELQSELVVPTGSAVIPILQQLQKKYPKLNWKVAGQFTQEELLFKVADGTIPYTVAVSVDVSAAQHIKPDIAIGFDLTDEVPVVWYLPNNGYSELQGAVLAFMNQVHETGLLARIEEKYFNHLNRFDYVDTQTFLRSIESTLPQYQSLFEKYQGNLDWLMLAAIAYQESHWDPNATSPTGVRGIMMLTRDTAARMNITDRTDAAQSIQAGSEYLHLLMSQLPQSILPEDRIWFGLAAYNMGMGHLLDARRLTRQLGGDPNNWLDVKRNLPLLAEKRYYTQLKYGYARGFEAFQYVENIRRYYNILTQHLRIKEQISQETK